ncbi:hypothetical protein TASIC1_0002038600 [Trichoderma asperellum]|uniref:Uncharacterized protein n=1 Tax=Trichoderma asperellum TaxID=101201 RepID=A0A6V8QM12_TRIAP|nr:hypothetical protein LI328DRAFT_158383 [Trichoderma asperelloides]GFP53202.1 hypothetical protein TASIC1_0002038600 [Trichoderma asperellum]
MKTASQHLRPLAIKQLITTAQAHHFPSQISNIRLFAFSTARSPQPRPPSRQTPSKPTPRTNFIQNKKPILRDTIRRFIPEEAKKFVRPDGTLCTTPETASIFLQHNIEPDNGAARRFTAGPAIQNACKAYHAVTAFSPRHIIHPHDLRFFDPRGHPLAAARREKYLRKSREEPLWIMVTSAGAASTVVRVQTQRRLKSAIYRCLEDLGLPNGIGEHKEIRGTVWVTLYDPVKASKLPPEPFAEAIARALKSRCAQPLR